MSAADAHGVLPVVDGRVVHGSGSLALRLTGAARAQAHSDIMDFTSVEDLSPGRRSAHNSALANIVRNDPSLLLEKIPAACPVRGAAGVSPPHVAARWRDRSKFSGRWLTRVLDIDVDCVEAVAIALKAGIHPDDEAVWPDGSLLAVQGWCTSPHKVQLALRFGALPARGGNWDDEYVTAALGPVLVGLQKSSVSSSDQEVLDGIRCVELLLEAGARKFERPAAQHTFPGDFCPPLSTIASLVDCGGARARSPIIQPRIHDLVRALHGAGADIDRRSGRLSLPPVVIALRHKDIETACLLVRLGCTTDDSIRRDSDQSSMSILSLVEEARRAGGEAFTTQISAAHMERQFAASIAGAVVVVAEKATPDRRTARVL